MKQKIVLKIFLLLLILIFQVDKVQADSPTSWVPAGSPLELGLHPRLGFIPQSYRDVNAEAMGLTINEMRARLSQTSPYNYKALFQRYIDYLDSSAVYDPSPETRMIAGYPNPDPDSGLIPAAGRVDVTYDAIGYAFLVMIDPASMAGITTQHTVAEYKAKAIDYAVYLANGAKNANNAESYEMWLWSDRYPTEYKSEIWIGEGPVSMTLAIVADWLNADLTQEQKELFVDAFINISSDPVDFEAFASAKHFGGAQNGAGVIGLFGDTFSLDYEEKVATLMQTVNNDWLLSFKDLSTTLFGEGLSNAVEGPNYNMFIGNNSLPFITLFSTAINENLIKTTSFFKGYADYSLYILMPQEILGNTGVLSTDDGGTNSDAKLQYGNKQSIWDALIYDSNTNDASLARWLRENRYKEEYSERLSEFGVLNYFFKGYKNNSIIPKSPSELNKPLSKNIGMGQYIMRTGFENENDTLISFMAPKYHLNSYHSHLDFAQFRIFKHGILVPDRQISKGYSEVIEDTKTSMFYNTIGVLKQAETSGGKNFMGYRTNIPTERYSNSSAYQENGTANVGTVVAEDLEMNSYDYVNYDYSNSWNDQKVTYADRQFVYLRSVGGQNDEYVVVNDRINAADSNYKKFFLLQSNFEPTLLNNSNNAITMTAQDYPNDPDGGGGRWVNMSSSPTQDNVVRLANNYDVHHGVLFNKTLFPDNFQINKIGGANHQWEDANGKLLNGSADTSEYFQTRWASYAVQIQSNTNQNFDRFLNVMQFGDSDTLTQMSVTTKIIGDTMTGTLINDPNAPRIVLFSNSQTNENVSSATYSATYPNDKTANHLLVDVEPGLYDVYKNNVKIFSNKDVSSSKQTLFFQTTGGGDFAITQVNDVTAPSAPSGLGVL